MARYKVTLNPYVNEPPFIPVCGCLWRLSLCWTCVWFGIGHCRLIAYMVVQVLLRLGDWVHRVDERKPQPSLLTLNCTTDQQQQRETRVQTRSWKYKLYTLLWVMSMGTIKKGKEWEAGNIELVSGREIYTPRNILRRKKSMASFFVI